MTPAELTAYNELCRRWPECDNANLHFEDAHKPSQMVRNWQNFHRLGDWEIDAAVIHHLESAILSKYAPGWVYLSPGMANEEHTYEGFPGDPHHIDGPSRLSACIAACRTVLSTKEPARE